MNALLLAAALVGGASLAAWVWLVTARGWFWRTDLRLPRLGEQAPAPGGKWPDTAIVVPARNEAEAIRTSLPALLRQDYPGRFHVFLVDDCSDDGTASAASAAARDEGAENRLTVIPGEPLRRGWVGKVWALRQGIRASRVMEPEYILLTDADIEHAPHSLRSLVWKARSGGLSLVSLMAQLRVETLWDRLLIPAYVFFFAKLYPFRWSNDPAKSTAAAAGGCILLRHEDLQQSGGIEAIAGELIDDCALARRVKHHGARDGGAGGRRKTWIGLTKDVRSLRLYGDVSSLWDLVARTAFAQLRFSPLLLAGTVLGMLFLYLAPPLGAAVGVAGLVLNPGPPTISLLAASAAAWALMAGSFVPMLRWYGVQPPLALLLTLAALLYTLMTVASAVRRWRGRGGGWKGRTYDLPGAAT